MILPILHLVFFQNQILYGSYSRNIYFPFKYLLEEIKAHLITLDRIVVVIIIATLLFIGL